MLLPLSASVCLSVCLCLSLCLLDGEGRGEAVAVAMEEGTAGGGWDISALHAVVMTIDYSRHPCCCCPSAPLPLSLCFPASHLTAIWTLVYYRGGGAAARGRGGGGGFRA